MSETEDRKNIIKANSFCNLGCSYFEKSQFDDAISSWEKAVKLFPKHIESHFNLAETFYKLGKIDEAIEKYKLIINIESQNPHAYFYLGEVYLSIKDFRQAIEVLKTAIQLEPLNDNFHYHLALAYHQNKQIDNAIIEYKYAIDINPEISEYHYYLAYAYHNKKEKNKSKYHYEIGCSLNPNNDLRSEFDLILKAKSTSNLQKYTLFEMENRNLSALFLDIVGYTEMINKFGDSKILPFINEFFSEVRLIVEKNGGWIDKFIGDAIFAIFGHNINYNHATRAIDCALKILEKLEERNKYSRYQIQIRTGINSGNVIIQKNNNERIFTGNVVNIASRIQTITNTGCVFVSESTKYFSEEFFEFSEIGQFILKGLSDPVNVFMAEKRKNINDKHLSIKHINSFRDTRIFSESELIGRNKQLSKLMGIFNSARFNKSNFSLIGLKGKRGFGKSRLFYEFEQNLENLLERKFILKGESNYFVSNPFENFKNLIENFFELNNQNNNINISVDDTLLKYFCQNSDYESMTLEQANEIINFFIVQKELLISEVNLDHYFNILYLFILKICSEVNRKINIPFVIFIEDIDKIDNYSLDFLNYLLKRTSNFPPLLIFISYTDVYKVPAFISSFNFFTEIALEPLDKKQGLELINILFEKYSTEKSNSTQINPIDLIISQKSLNYDLKNKILDECDGNPFFIQEFVKYIFVDKITNISKDLIIPRTIEEDILTVLDTLNNKELINILKILSVVGMKFQLVLLENIIDAIYQNEKIDLNNFLKIAKENKLLIETNDFDGQYFSFENILLQKVIYSTIFIQNKMLIHKIVAEEIINLYSENLENYYEIIASHYMKSDFQNEAVYYLELAAENCFKQEDYFHALKLYEKTFDILRANENKDKLTYIIKKQINILILLKNYHKAFEKCNDLDKEFNGVFDNETERMKSVILYQLNK